MMEDIVRNNDEVLDDQREQLTFSHKVNINTAQPVCRFNVIRVSG